MKKLIIMLLMSTLVVASGCRREESPPVPAKVELSGIDYPPDSDYPIQPKLFSEVAVKDNFWKPKIKTNTEVTIPFVIQKFAETGRPIRDNVLQAAIYSLQTYPDSPLQAKVDSRIQEIKAEQEETASSSNGLFEVAAAYYAATGKRDLLEFKATSKLPTSSVCRDSQRF